MATKAEALLAELVNDPEVRPDDLADAWIVFGAKVTNPVFVALANDSVAARAVYHVIEPKQSPLREASETFLSQLVMSRGYDKLAPWVRACRAYLEIDDLDSAVMTVSKSLERWLASHGETVIRSRRSWRILFDSLSEDLAPDVLLDAAAEVAAHHPDLEATEDRVRTLLAVVAKRNEIVHGLAGEPRRVLDVDDLTDSTLRQARLAGEAIATIWEERMLEPKAAAEALRAKATNREKVRSYRERSWLLGLPRDRSYLYPAFQFDPRRRELYPEVRQVNELLDAAADPWGVASWWVSPNDRLGGARPLDLVGEVRAEEVIRAAQAVVEPIG
jgi:hypothetical protein